MSKKWILPVFSIFIQGAFLSGQDIINTQNTDACVIELNIEDLSITPVSQGVQTLNRIDFKDNVPYGNSGEPLIPSRVFLIALPPGMDGQVSIQKSDPMTLEGLVPVPFETIIPGDAFSEYSYVLGPVYESAGPFPGKSFQIEETGFMGGQRIMRIRIFPVEYMPAEKKAIVYKRLIVNVNFVQSHAPAREALYIADPVVKKIIANANQIEEQPEKTFDGRVYKRSENPQGEWYQIPVTEEGIYRITGAMLRDAGIELSAIDPLTIKIYNNGGKMLPEDLSEKRPEGFVENPVWVNAGQESHFSSGDEILFYGRGLQHAYFDSAGQRMRHTNHLYANENYYWLVFNDGVSGRRWETSGFSQPPLPPYETAEELVFFEEDINNPVGAGIRWYGHAFNAESASTHRRSYSVDLPGVSSGSNIQTRFRFAAAAMGMHTFSMSLNNSSIGTVSLSHSSVNEFPLTYTGQINSEGNALNIQYSYSGSQTSASSYLDWFEIVYKRNLIPHRGVLTFFSVKESGIAQYKLSGFAEPPLVLDVTAINNIRKFELITESDGVLFSDDASEYDRRRFIAVEPSGFLTPDRIEKKVLSNPRVSSLAADMIIITHSDFLNQAERLAAHRSSQDEMTTAVFTIADVYNYFSGGLQDPAAIRDFVHYAFHNWNRPPRYLLLFGGGHYDYRNIITDQPVFVAPYYIDGTVLSSAAAIDDWYTYVNGNDRLMDLSVGRIPVQNSEQAGIVVDKIIQYDSDPKWGNWKNVITLLADDERSAPGVDNEIRHLYATEQLYRNGDIPEKFDISKIYLTEFPEVITAHGRRKPQARDAFINQINQGTVLVNFIGHGNPGVWTHERMFQRDMDMIHLENGRMLPLFYGATCSFSQYDNPNEQSFAQELLAAGNEGAIAAIGSTRECWAAPNESLNRFFIRYLLNENGMDLRVGDALRMAKAVSGMQTNNEKFHLFGDPSMRLSLPVNNVYITEMLPDSLKALGITQVKGYVGSEEGVMHDFNGMIFLQSFDSKTTKLHTLYGGAGTVEYDLPGNTLFRGEAEVSNGIFEMAFIVPKDISYRGDTGRLNAYAWSNDSDAGGFKGGISVGGSVDVHDTEGPEIRIEFEEDIETFDGDLINSPALLTVILYDELTGINIAGEIGHKIMLSVNSEDEDVTGHFKYDPGSYLKGRLQYPLDFLEPGEHEIEIKAWDNANNSSQKPLYFQIVDGSSLVLERVLNYPNPMQASTHFTFTLNMDAEVDVKIYTVSGRMIRHLDAYYAYAGFNMIPWDGLDDMGDRPANGVYLYKLTAAAQTGTETLKKEEIGRLMIMN